MNRSVHIRVQGIVQGVFFRQHTKEEAVRLGVKGWVRNCEDGSVEAEAEGEEKALREFIEWCHHGPQQAVVTKIDVREIPFRNFSSFEVRR